MSSVKIQGKHIVAARALLGMTQEQLAKAAGVTQETVSNVEIGKTVGAPATMERLALALENRGIEFTNGEGTGVRHVPAKAIIPV